MNMRRYAGMESFSAFGRQLFLLPKSSFNDIFE